MTVGGREAAAELRYAGRSVPLAPGQSVLEALEAAGVPLRSGCRSGVCGACLVRATAGDVPAAAQRGLSPVLTARGVFLACQARPRADLELEPADALPETRAWITALEDLGRDVRRVRLVPERPLDHTPGQFAVVRGPNGVERSYSLASLPEEEALELHVRRIPGGALSEWFFAGAALGGEVLLRGPLGTCCYVPDRPEQPLILVGAGTGLAPLVGILRDALARGHRGPIALYHGARDEGGLYLEGELAALERAHEHVRVVRCALTGPVSDPSVRVGGLAETVLADHPNLNGVRLFLCGDGPLVRSLRRTFFLAGAASADLLADPFDAAAAGSKAG